MQNWDDLRYFLAIARFGSLAAAARALGVNHSTVFRRLNALETATSVRLFDRLPSGYVLTEGGEDLLESVASVGEIIDGLDRRLVGRDYQLKGTARVTTTDTIAVSTLHHYLRRFHETYPDVVVEVATDNLFFDLSRREADVALRPANTPPEHLVGRNLGSVAWGVYASTKYLTGHGRPGAVSDLPDFAIITGSDSLTSVPAVRWTRTQVPESAIVFRASSFVVQLAAAKSGFGLAVLPCFLADPEDELERVLGPIEELSSGLWLLTHPDLRESVRIRALMAFLTEAIKEDQDKYSGAFTRR